jgi:hypothetical protein
VELYLHSPIRLHGGMLNYGQRQFYPTHLPSFRQQPCALLTPRTRSAPLVILLLSPIGSLCSPRRPMRTHDLPCSCILCLTQTGASGKRNALAAFTLVSSVAYSLTVRMEVTRSSDKLIVFQRTTRCYIPENTTLHCDRVL